MTQENLTVGSVVRIKDDAPMGAGELAYVYETYRDFNDPRQLGASLITESGNDTGGWSNQEQEKFLDFVGHHQFQYEFNNVIQLMRDFQTGIFTHVFEQFRN